MNMQLKNRISMWVLRLRNIRLPITLSGIAIAVFLLREAIATTADITALVSSANSISALFILVAVIALNILILIFFDNISSDVELSKNESGQNKIIRRREEKRLAQSYKFVNLSLSVVVIIVSCALIMTIVQLSQINPIYLEVYGEIQEQTRLKTEQLRQSLYPIPAPPRGALVHLWESFESSNNQIGSFQDYMTVINGRSQVIQDPESPYNHYYLIQADALPSYFTLRSGIPGRNFVFYFRIRKLGNYNSINDGNLMDAPFSPIQDSLWHTVLMTMDPLGNSELFIDGVDRGSQAVERSDDKEFENYDLTQVFTMGPYDISAYDDIILWSI